MGKNMKTKEYQVWFNIKISEGNPLLEEDVYVEAVSKMEASKKAKEALLKLISISIISVDEVPSGDID